MSAPTPAPEPPPTLRCEFLDMLKHHGDKLLLTTLLLAMLSVLLHLLHHDATSAAVAWLEKSIDVVLGSLLTLITGTFMRKDNKQ